MHNDLNLIKTRVPSGAKYKTKVGTSAIKDGVKAAGVKTKEPRHSSPKPKWLRIKIPAGGKSGKLRALVRSHKLVTVCEESHCPNLAECWNNGTATIMLMGDVCTRACKFCAVDTGNPNGWLDPNEPQTVARSVMLMDLRYIVLTSVDRDDLPDGGSDHFVKTVRAIKRLCPNTAVEALTPDFGGDTKCIKAVADSGIEVLRKIWKLFVG